MAEHPRYHIKTVADFLTIPEDKLGHAIFDFANWIAFAISGETKKALKEIPGLEIDLSEFIWVDDGKHEIIPQLQVKEPAEGSKP